MKPKSFVCPVCARVSYNSNDIQNGYCGSCHQYTGDLRSFNGGLLLAAQQLWRKRWLRSDRDGDWWELFPGGWHLVRGDSDVEHDYPVERFELEKDYGPTRLLWWSDVNVCEAHVQQRCVVCSQHSKHWCFDCTYYNLSGMHAHACPNRQTPDSSWRMSK